MLDNNEYKTHPEGIVIERLEEAGDVDRNGLAVIGRDDLGDGRQRRRVVQRVGLDGAARGLGPVPYHVDTVPYQLADAQADWWRWYWKFMFLC